MKKLKLCIDCAHFNKGLCERKTSLVWGIPLIRYALEQREAWLQCGKRARFFYPKNPYKDVPGPASGGLK